MVDASADGVEILVYPGSFEATPRSAFLRAFVSYLDLRRTVPFPLVLFFARVKLLEISLTSSPSPASTDENG